MHINATNARANLYRLIEQTNKTSKPVTITSAHGDAVLIGKADWDAIQETLYLSSIPGMVESIKAAAAEDESDAVGIDEVDWDAL